MTQSLLTKKEIKYKVAKKKIINSKHFLFIFVLLVITLSTIGYIYNQANQTNENQIDQEINIKEQRFEQLVTKLKTEELSDAEWSEVCELLAEFKNIFINDCADCRNYLKAFLGGKHAVHLEQYLQRPTKEIKKGIKSYQKQIDEHFDKITNPRKHIPEWDKLDPRHRKNLQEKKWNQDIRRLKEQKEILECILKNK